ncbi:RNA polymerase sigma factor [Murinocardiopsis flavida]|uniref:RNA polymerase sigma factor n=1 Tax=Murinocardiopsis flavida TaxID=645275 RepID=UPI00147356BC|nr:sigma-70 family RNA polymerase sigma factor [Murinocardiopsis flavida]
MDDDSGTDRGRHSPPTAELVRRAAQDDPEAWDQLLRRYEHRVWRLLRSFRLPAHDAHDVAQEVWLIVAQKLPTIARPDRFERWLHTVARHECVRHLRRARRWVPVPPDRLDLPVERDPSAIHAEREGVRAVRAALDRLHDPDRRIATLCLEAPELTGPEIAVLVGIPAAELPNARRRAFRRLRRLLRPPQSAEPPADQDTREAGADAHRKRSHRR